MRLGRIVGPGIGGGGEENAGISGQGTQIVILRHRPALRIEASIEVPHHDLLQHELEEIGLVIAGDERVHRATELLELRRRKTTERRKSEIDERDSSVRWDTLNRRPDANGFLADRVGSTAAQFFELFLTRGCVFGEQESADQGVGA